MGIKGLTELDQNLSASGQVTHLLWVSETHHQLPVHLAEPSCLPQGTALHPGVPYVGGNHAQFLLLLVLGRWPRHLPPKLQLTQHEEGQDPLEH